MNVFCVKNDFSIFNLRFLHSLNAYVTNSPSKVETRDKEIDRLKNMLNGGRPIEAVFTDNHRSSSDRVVAHLNIQVYIF